MYMSCVSMFIACIEKKTPSELMQEYINNNVNREQSGYSGVNSGYNTSSQTEMCPMCNGAGSIQDVPGSPVSSYILCSVCGGSGVCDAATAKKVRDARIQVERQYGGTSLSGNYRGGSNLSGERRCWNCNGRGNCSACAGRGEYYAKGTIGQPGRYLDCPTCKGTGRCTICNGRGTR